MNQKTNRVGRESFFFLFVLIAYFALIIPTLHRSGITWDEQTDLNIAREYLQNPSTLVEGTSLDLSQTRLPMFVGFLVFKIFNVSDLITARLLSVFVGALTLLGVFVYARRRFQYGTGVLACALLATSPFFLSFARIAFTECDIFLACTFIWMLWSLDKLQEHRSFQRAVVTGIFFGLSIGSKATAIAALPAIIFAIVDSKNNIKQKRTRRFLLPIACLTALIIFFIAPPEHFTNPAIIRSLLDRASSEMTLNFGLVYQSLSLPLLSVFFKSSPLIGATLLSSIIYSIYVSRSRPELRLPVILFLGYFFCLVSLPLAQTFYFVPLLPLLALFCASMILDLLQNKKWKQFTIVYLSLAVSLWAVDMIRCYPDFNLNGYQWIGERRIGGRSSVGYRSIVQTTSDGIEQSLRWLNENAKAGDRVATFFREQHIKDAVAQLGKYIIENELGKTQTPDADYIVLHINVPVDSIWMVEHYKKVFNVTRKFGIEVASVWQKR
jgi:4-amino-4-deoxy-L-arabinose transferase-like glycosyltransferase